jgi:hypothetical protein
MTTRASSHPSDEQPYTGRYGGSAISFPRRATAGQPTVRPRPGKAPAPDWQQGYTFGLHPADEPYDTDSFDDVMEGADYPGEPIRRRTSAYYQPTTSPRQRRETMHLQPKPTKVIRQHRFDRSTLVIWLCLALIVMVGGWWLLSAVSSWWANWQDDLHYGTPRTFQADQYVGLGDSPAHPDHFLALNLHGMIEVVLLDPQDSQKDAVFVLANVGNASTPASLSFRDTTGDGRTDVIVTIGDSTPYTIVLLNTGKTFVPTQPAR